jgi:hypothetical protein
LTIEASYYFVNYSVSFVARDNFTSLILPGLDYLDQHVHKTRGMDVSETWSKHFKPIVGFVTLIYPLYHINNKNTKKDIIPSTSVLVYQLNHDGDDHSEIPWTQIENGSILRIKVLLHLQFLTIAGAAHSLPFVEWQLRRLGNATPLGGTQKRTFSPTKCRYRIDVMDCVLN